MTKDRCDLCGREALEPVYAAEPSPRGLTVWLCTHCALVQSVPRIDHVDARKRAASAGADWGNIRYGKGFRTDATLHLLLPHLTQGAPIVLDVGANRGAFVEKFLDKVPGARMIAVEPDKTVVDTYAARDDVQLIASRIESVDLPSESVDVIHSCHTIEHLRSPRTTLADHWRVLKPDGLLYAEVPNLALLAAPDLVEEWFIDKHLYHYSQDVFVRQIEASGFMLIAGPDPADDTNIAVVARKTAWPSRMDLADPREVVVTRSLLTTYKAQRATTRTTMRQLARRLDALADKPLALWGAGRLLNALIEIGEFDPSRAAAIVDTHLAQHGLMVAGRPVSPPRALETLRPRTIVVMSRLFEREITAQARTLVPDADILTYADLFRTERLEARP